MLGAAADQRGHRHRQAAAAPRLVQHPRGDRPAAVAGVDHAVTLAQQRQLPVGAGRQATGTGEQPVEQRPARLAVQHRAQPDPQGGRRPRRQLDRAEHGQVEVVVVDHAGGGGVDQAEHRRRVGAGGQHPRRLSRLARLAHVGDQHDGGTVGDCRIFDRYHRETAQSRDLRHLHQEPGVPHPGLAADLQRAPAVGLQPGEELVRDGERAVAFPQPRGAGIAPARRVVSDRAAPAAPLGQVVAPVRAADQFVGGVRVVRVGGHAEADRHGQRRLAGEVAGAYLVGQPYRQPQRVGLLDVRQQQDELVAAVPEERVHRPDRALDPVGELAQYLVATLVAVGVVDGLEEVDVEEEDGATGTVAVRPRQRVGEHRLEQGARNRTGDRIGHRRGGTVPTLAHHTPEPFALPAVSVRGRGC